MLSSPESIERRETSIDLSVIIPAWNEADVISQAIDEAVTTLAELGVSYELIIVDDGSSDETAQIVESVMQSEPIVRLIQHSQNRGYGAALRSGFEASHGKVVAFTDADCQFQLSDLKELMVLAERYDIVSGYRIDRKDSQLRCFFSWGYNTLIRVLLRSPLRDIDCALKVFHRESLLRILPASENFFANTEMMTQGRRLGLSINEVGVTHRPRAAGTSSVSIREIPRVLNSLLPHWWQKVQFPGTDHVERQSPSIAVLSLILAVAGVLLFRGLAYPLVEPDEGRYAQISREMLRSGDCIIPQLHHEPYLDKPPLFYWLCAASFSIFGATEWAARLVPALAAWMTIGMTYLFGCRLLGRTSAGLGTMALSLSFGFLTCGRFLILDSVLALFVTASLFTAYRACARDRLHWGWWISSAVSCGLGILTKGPVAFVLVTPPVLAHCWLTHRRHGLRLRPYIGYSMIAALTAVPWFVAASVRMPEFVHYFFWEHNVERFLSGSNHPEPFWFYVPTLFLACMPWGVLLFPLTKFLLGQSPQTRRYRSPAVGFLALWAGWGLLFFSLSSGKLPPYILPCVPAVMLLLGQYVSASCSPFAQNVYLRARAHALFHRGAISLASLGLLFAGTLFLLGLDDRSHTAQSGSPCSRSCWRFTNTLRRRQPMDCSASSHLSHYRRFNWICCRISRCREAGLVIQRIQSATTRRKRGTCLWPVSPETGDPSPSTSTGMT